MTGPPQAVGDWDRTRETHAGLSPVDVRFRELAMTDPELLRGADRLTEDRLLRSPRQVWPLFISSRRLRELADAAIAVSRLFRSIPERLFHNDADRMAEFYRQDSTLLRIGLQPPNGITDGMSRSDFIDGRSGFKCAEFNFGGNLGGFDNGLVARITLETPAIQRFVAGLGQRVRHRNTFRLLARHAIYQALKTRISGGEVNVALLHSAAPEGRDALSAFFTREYEALLAAIGPPLRGRFVLCTTEELTVRNNALYRFGTRLHIVVEGDTTRPRPTVVQCFKAGNLVLYNGPMSALISDKRNVALLSENAASDDFSAEEKAVIERHIPWSRHLAPGATTYQGERHQLERLVLARREDLVLKKAWSYGGADVLLGRDTAPPEWEHAVRRSLAAGDWMVQEYVESHSYLFQHGEGCQSHKAVWGPYVFGDDFGGMFMRVQPEAHGGIINAALGATHASLLEVEDAPEPAPTGESGTAARPGGAVS